MGRSKHWVAALLLLLVGWQPVSARTIGLVYDDSGSMAGSIQLPAFGVQLLVSTLDGRDGHDRLFTIKLSETSVTRQDLRTPERTGRTIDTVRRDWVKAEMSTPYKPVDLMLQTLARETSDGEKAYLVIVTDGAFNVDVPTPPVLRAAYQTYKRQIKGRLEVLFLFIDRGGADRQTIETQKVYSTLLDVFGGAPDENLRFVRDASQLKEALVHFVAKISETNLDRNNTVVRRNGNAIDLTLPFSVTRIISLGVGPDARSPPQVTRPSFDMAERLDFQPSMAQADGYFPTRLVGRVTQIRMEPALGPGDRHIEFSGPVGDETVLLFRSEVGLRWKLFEASREINQDSRGGVEVTQGRQYKLVAQVQDRVAGTDTVLPSKIPGAVVTATIVAPSGKVRSLSLTSSDSDQGFSADITFDEEGPHEIRLAMRLPGFATDRVVTAAVLARAFDLSMRLQRVESCPPHTDCPDGVLPVRVQQTNAPAGTVGHIEVSGTPPPRRTGQFRLDISNLQGGFEVLGPDHLPVKPTSLYSLSAGQTVGFDIVRPSRWRPSFGAGGRTEATIKAIAAQPLEGEASLVFRVLPYMPDPILNYRGHDQDRGGSRPLVLDLPGSEHGRQAFDFYIENALDVPRVKNLSVANSSWLLGLLTKADVRLPPPKSEGASGYAFSVHPRVPWWCQCFLGLATTVGMPVDTTLTVTYDPQDGRHAASAEVPLGFSSEGWSPLFVWSGCVWLLLLMLLIAYILRVLYALLAAHRFPRAARFYVFEFGHTESLVKKVRNSIWFDLRSALLMRVPRHRYRLDSLLVEAERDQLRLRTVAHEWPPYTSVKHAKSLQDIAEQMVKRKQAARPADAIISISWGNMIEDTMLGGRRLVFVRDFSRRPEAAVTREVTV